MNEWNKNLQDKVVNYAGIWNKDKANGKLFFHIDTAWVNRGAGNIKPQYLISAAHVDVPGTPGVPCTYAHNHNEMFNFCFFIVSDDFSRIQISRSHLLETICQYIQAVTHVNSLNERECCLVEDA